MNYRRLWALILPFLLVANTAYASAFPDVPEYNEHFRAVEYLKDNGIVGGYSDGTFQPDKEINRVEALKIILLSTDIEIRTEFETEVSFPDVAEDQWFYYYVLEALTRGVVSGYSDGTFQPGNQINLVETLKMSILAFGLETEQNDSGNWYDPYLNFAYSKNILVDEVQPDTLMTRGSFAEILYRFAFMQDHGLDSFPLSQDWESYEKSADYYKLKLPPDWLVREENTRTVIWKKTENQLDYNRLTPNSAVLILHKKDNLEGLDKALAFAEIEELTNQIFYPREVAKNEFVINDMPVISFDVPERNIRDYYFYLPNSKILIAYGETGNGGSKDKNMKYIETAVKNITFVDSGQPDEAAEKQALRTQINQNLLVEGVGMSIVNALPDASLFETDAIGVGTGPVDYYYSAYLNLTLKYERASDIILNTRDGKTSKF
ncbi:S-layer homology domain-containing protein [Patescibacteria group bacterium]|nr:S-layer homology domain-containing protein [Patescibacteria group bacterium]